MRKAAACVDEIEIEDAAAVEKEKKESGEKQTERPNTLQENVLAGSEEAGRDILRRAIAQLEAGSAGPQDRARHLREQRIENDAAQLKEVVRGWSPGRRGLTDLAKETESAWRLLANAMAPKNEERHGGPARWGQISESVRSYMAAMWRWQEWKERYKIVGRDGMTMLNTEASKRAADQAPAVILLNRFPYDPERKEFSESKGKRPGCVPATNAWIDNNSCVLGLLTQNGAPKETPSIRLIVRCVTRALAGAKGEPEGARAKRISELGKRVRVVGLRKDGTIGLVKVKPAVAGQVLADLAAGKPWDPGDNPFQIGKEPEWSDPEQCETWARPGEPVIVLADPRQLKDREEERNGKVIQHGYYAFADGRKNEKDQGQVHPNALVEVACTRMGGVRDLALMGSQRSQGDDFQRSPLRRRGQIVDGITKAEPAVNYVMLEATTAAYAQGEPNGMRVVLWRDWAPKPESNLVKPLPHEVEGRTDLDLAGWLRAVLRVRAEPNVEREPMTRETPEQDSWRRNASTCRSASCARTPCGSYGW